MRLFKFDKEYIVYASIYILIFILIYLFNFENFSNFEANDFSKKYLINGNKLLSNFELNQIFNQYLIYEIVVAIVSIFFDTIKEIRISLDIINIFFFGFSITNIFFLINKKKKVLFLSLTFIVLIYKPLWHYIFFKLADPIYLFFISIYFLKLKEAIEEKKYYFHLYFFSIVLLYIKPTGIIFLIFTILLQLKLLNYKYIMGFIFAFIFLYPAILILLYDKVSILNEIFFFTKYLIIHEDLYISDYSILFNSDYLNYLSTILIKFITFFINIRPSLSYNHNIFLIFYNLILYSISIVGFRILFKKNFEFFNLIFSYILLTTTMHAILTIGSSSMRLQYMILVPILFLFINGFDNIFKKIFYK